MRKIDKKAAKKKATKKNVKRQSFNGAEAILLTENVAHSIKRAEETLARCADNLANLDVDYITFSCHRLATGLRFYLASVSTSINIVKYNNLKYTDWHRIEKICNFLESIDVVASNFVKLIGLQVKCNIAKILEETIGKISKDMWNMYCETVTKLISVNNKLVHFFNINPYRHFPDTESVNKVLLLERNMEDGLKAIKNKAGTQLPALKERFDKERRTFDAKDAAHAASCGDPALLQGSWGWLCA